MFGRSWRAPPGTSAASRSEPARPSGGYERLGPRHLEHRERPAGRPGPGRGPFVRGRGVGPGPWTPALCGQDCLGQGSPWFRACAARGPAPGALSRAGPGSSVWWRRECRGASDRRGERCSSAPAARRIRAAGAGRGGRPRRGRRSYTATCGMRSQRVSVLLGAVNYRAVRPRRGFG